jgi:hypothetical protein
MPTDAVRCRVDVLVEDGKIEEAIRELKRLSISVRAELKRRRRDGPKPSERRRNKRYFAAAKRWRFRYPYGSRGDDELERSRRDQAVYTERLATRGLRGEG